MIHSLVTSPLDHFGASFTDAATFGVDRIIQSNTPVVKLRVWSTEETVVDKRLDDRGYI